MLVCWPGKTVKLCMVSDLLLVKQRDQNLHFFHFQLVVSAITLLFSFIVGLFFMVASALKIMNQERNIPSTATKQNEKENYNENHTQIPNSYGSTNNFLESTRERSSKASDSSCSLQSLGGTKRVVETREEVDSRLEQTPLLQSTSSDSHKSSTMQFLLLLLFLLFSCLVVCCYGSACTVPAS